MKEDPNPDLCKFLICKLGLDSLRNRASELDFLPWFVSTKPRSCSSKPWKCRPSVRKLEKSQSCWRISRPDNITLPSSPCHNYFNRRDALKRNERFVASTAPLVLAISGHGSMLNVGCTAVMKVSTGSDFPFCDYDDIAEKNNNSKDDCVAHQFKDIFDGCFKNSQASPSKMISGFKNNKASPSKTASDVGRKLRTSHLPEQDYPASIDILRLPSRNGISWINSNVNSNDDDDDDECWQTFNLTTPKGGGSDTVFNEHRKEDAIITLDFHSGHDQASPYRKTTNSMGKTSKLPIEKHARKDQSEIYEKLYTSPLPVSPFGGKCCQIERSESEPDELCVKEIEGESLVAKLRRQVEFDRKTIMKLYEEIDKERNAAAEAARQAMAMITKLQEEKALIDLDALHCVRMMEQQAEHDSVSLEKAYVLLAEKEQEIQDLEAKLVFYRSKYSDEYKEEQMCLTRKHVSVVRGKNKERERLQTHSMKTKKGGKSPEKREF